MSNNYDSLPATMFIKIIGFLLPWRVKYYWVYQFRRLDCLEHSLVTIRAVGLYFSERVIDWPAEASVHLGVSSNLSRARRSLHLETRLILQ